MSQWIHVPWEELFVLDRSPLETIVRGSLVFVSLFLLLRFGLRREWGIVGMADLLVVVLIAEAATGAMGANVQSLPDCVLLGGTIVFWAYALDWLGYRFSIIGRLLRPLPLPLVRNGRMLRRNMRSELITAEELTSQMREHGLDNVSEVREAYIEGDGHISIVPYDRGNSSTSPRHNVV